ncbi:MAG: hypothetical protein GC181_06620 [Bacteroidetes bacterium]|nr:hypothetical protein [Bacteroidota bacterium]
MQFVYPAFLWSLLILTIPVIIHLFHFRRYRKIIFPHVRFLQNLQKETQNIKRLRNILVLISRLLAFAFLILAFAQPFIPVSKRSHIPDQIISIFIDNSFSMEREGTEGPVFEEAKSKAREIVRAYPGTTRFQITNVDANSSGRAVGKDEAIARIDEMSISPVSTSLSEIIKTQQFGLDKLGVGIKQMYLISDFQKSVNTEIEKADSSMIVQAVPVTPSAIENLSIDSVWLEDPNIQINETFNLHVAIRNNGLDEINDATVTLDVDGVRKSAAGFDVSPGQKKEVILGVQLNKAGWQKGVLKVEDESVVFDNTYYITFNLKKNSTVFCVNENGANPFITKLFSNDNFFNLVNSDKGNLDLSILSKSDLLILNELRDISNGLVTAITKFVNDGGTVLIIPSPEGKSGMLNNLTTALNLPEYGDRKKNDWRVSKVNIKHPLFSNVFKKVPENPDFPNVKEFYSLQGSDAQQVMSLQNGDIFLAGSNTGNGFAYSLCAPLNTDWTSFPQHALFVPALLRMSMTRSGDLPLAYTINRNNVFRSVAESGVLQGSLKLKSSDREWMPVLNQFGTNSYIDAGNEEVEAGNLELISGDSLLQIASFNYPRTESTMEQFTESDLKSIFAGTDFRYTDKTSDQLSHAIKQQREGKQYWKLCIILSLIFLAIEILLLRFWPETVRQSQHANNPSVA